jgi:hypothetical protein
MFDQIHDQKMTITTRRGETRPKEELEQGGRVYTIIINKYDQKTKHNREGKCSTNCIIKSDDDN